MTAPAPESADFSLACYSSTLRAYLADGYAVTGFRDYLEKPTERHLVLRHDIDNDIDLALRVARVDAQAGCTSTFFLRVHARGYNLLSLPSLICVREMEELGHEVQLHLEGGFREVLGGTDFDWA